jgi:hypothetical protein
MIALHRVLAGAGQEEISVAAKSPKTAEQPEAKPKPKDPPREIGGPKGPEPTRYNDWEKAGRCVDF